VEVWGAGTTERPHTATGAPSQHSLVAAAEAALRTTLGAALRAPTCDGEVAGPRLRLAVRELCADAHRRHARAEDVIVAVKQAWAALAGLTAQPGELRRGEILRHFITVCIDEFYAEHRAADGAE
jgi:hypothetical protein